MNDLTFGKITVHASVYLPVLYAVWVNILLLLKRLFYRKIRKMAEHTRTDLDDIFLDSLEKPLVFMIFASGLYVIQTIFGLGIEGDFLKTVDLVF
ncbi:MAG: hypothetical protein PHT95_01220 [Candidatus Omnitrophica bacterium]|nr:hypothetical protein [Candidatus Omnitrophota bacterium]